MSLDTWKLEFYPKEAKKTTQSEAIEHSLQKWRGLTEENLKKHEVDTLRNNVVEEDSYERFAFDAASCSLCFHYYADLPEPDSDDDEAWEEYNNSESCETCPLYKILGKSCDDGFESPWRQFSECGNPFPMISALEKTLENSKEK